MPKSSWNLTLTAPVTVRSSVLETWMGYLTLIDASGIAWAALDTHSGSLSVNAGYSWNGCSPKFRAFGRTFGTPDGDLLQAQHLSEVTSSLDFANDLANGLSLGAYEGLMPAFKGLPWTAPASLAHDVLYQWLDPLAALGFKRWRADKLFGEILQALGWPAAGLYTSAVEVFGGVAHRINAKAYAGCTVKVDDHPYTAWDAAK